MIWKIALDQALDRSYEDALDAIYLQYFNPQSPDGLPQAGHEFEAKPNQAGNARQAADHKCALHERSATHNGLPRRPGGRA